MMKYKITLPFTIDICFVNDSIWPYLFFTLLLIELALEWEKTKRPKKKSKKRPIGTKKRK